MLLSRKMDAVVPQVVYYYLLQRDLPLLFSALEINQCVKGSHLIFLPF